MEAIFDLFTILIHSFPNGASKVMFEHAIIKLQIISIANVSIALVCHLDGIVGRSKQEMS